MQNVLHPRATTTPRIRKEIQESKESLIVLSKRYNINPKTVTKWRKSKTIFDKKSGAIKVRTVLSDKEQAIICEFRRVTKLPLDDVFVALKSQIPVLSRSNLYRCLRRNGLNTLPREKTDKTPVKKFKNYAIGFIHIDIAQVHTSEGKAYLFVGIDRKTRSVYAEIYDKMTMKNTCVFLKNLIAHFPFKINKILTDNGAQFTYRLLAKHLTPKNKIHPFDAICKLEKIEHRLTQFCHPWTNGLVERMNRTIKEATIKIYFYEDLDELKKHLMLWLLMYNYEKKLKSLNYESPYDIILKEFDEKASNFKESPSQKLKALNI